MKEIATFLGGAGKHMAVVYEIDNMGSVCYNVSCASKGSSATINKFFMTEEEANNFATEYISRDNQPTFLAE
jgi:hypothetical protein